MRTTHTLNPDDVTEAVDLLLEKRGERRVGSISIDYTSAGADRPSDPMSWTIDVTAEKALPSPQR